MATTAQEFFREKTQLPTELRTREFARLPLWVKEQSFFMAGVIRAEILDVFRGAAQAVVDGTVSEQEALRIIREGLAKSGYKPEPGQEGTIKDLNSVHRQLINLRTNVALARGWTTDAEIRLNSDLFPAYELKRGAFAEVPRLWKEKLWPETVRDSDSKASPDRMAALIDDPVWLALSDFGTPYAPLKWGSGMGQIAIGRRKAREWGLVPQTGPIPKAKPPESLNSTLEVTSKITDPAARQRVVDDLQGLAAWSGDKIVFTDPNGSRPWPVAVLSNLLAIDNIDGTENYQKRAIREWRDLGGDAAALKKMQEEFAGTDLLDDWNMLVRRLAKGEKLTKIGDLVKALAELAKSLFS